MDQKDLDRLIDDGNKLAALAAPAFEAQQKLAAIEKTAAELREENDRLRTAAESRTERIKLAAEGAANFFESCGTLKTASKAEFVARLEHSPEAIFELARDFADKVASEQVGQATAKQAGADAPDADPIDRFLHKS